MTRLKISGAASLLALMALAGCGRVGDVERPGPLFGQQAREDWAAQQAAKQADRDAASARQTKPAADQTDPVDPNADNAPRTRREVQAPEQENIPISKEPIPGQQDIVGPTPSMRPPGGL